MARRTAARRAQDIPSPLTGMPTSAKLYVRRATVYDWRTELWDAGYGGTTLFLLPELEARAHA